MKDSGSYFIAMAIALVIGLVLQLLTLPFLLFANYETLILIYCFGGAIISCVYIAIDLYLISDRLGIDDYILGAVILYIDILRLFIFIL